MQVPPPPQADIQSQIGRHLRALYDGVVAQPVPDRFIELLAQLDEKAARSHDDTAGPQGPGPAPEGGDKGQG